MKKNAGMRNVFVFFFLLLFLPLALSAQNGASGTGTIKVKKPDDDEAYGVADQKAEPAYNFRAYLAKHINYPDSCKSKKQEGAVIIEFIVEKDGSITNAVVLRGVAGAVELEQEALRVARTMLPWKPAMMQGVPVRMYATIPISFRLR